MNISIPNFFAKCKKSNHQQNINYTQLLKICDNLEEKLNKHEHSYDWYSGACYVLHLLVDEED